jgi:hypothetical protein
VGSPRHGVIRQIPEKVFINVPFDKAYEPLFVALIVGLVAMRRVPRSVLEITETGQGRLQRLISLVQDCQASVHDLSRVGLPPRFNMPFELGLVYAVSQLKGAHDLHVLEAIPYRLDKTLSDFKGRDPLIHRNTARGMILRVLDAFGRADSNPTLESILSVYRQSQKYVTDLKQHRREDTVFNRATFVELVSYVTKIWK